MLFSGSGVALITPFTKDGVNLDAYGKLIDLHLNEGTDALFVLGTTGEPATMTAEEKTKVVEFAIAKVNKRIPVFVGSGGNNTADVVKNSKLYADMGADGLLVVTPYYNKCTQNGLVEHFRAISGNVNVPIVAYNVPGRTGFNVLPATYLKLAEIKNIAAIKEACGDMGQISEVIRLVGDKLDIYSGDDHLVVPAMSLGAKGVISVAANIIPKTMHDLVALCLDNKFKEAASLHFRIAPLLKSLFCEVNPIPVKKAAGLLGFDAGIPRLPLTEAENSTVELLKTEMQKLNLI